jgi:UDP-N-acetylglucosamine diphosphorylase / glucose-1-phosphate thymidylyltransferase / UDP-N-acetylgalactosamine diphosphorylase / glucosamine-1-phosphate N-acetyltransferase / galactosamine-1-phosphate N-acetyltransferase
MQAVIMAAGSSTRTHPLTATRPKPLVPIWGRPLLEHQMRQLAGLVDEVVLVVGFLRQQIEDRFGRSFEGTAIRYAPQERQRGTADALLAARPFLSGRSLVLNGDDFYHRDDLKGLAETGRGLLVTRARDPQNRAVVDIDDGIITGIVEKPPHPPKDSWCSVGGYCIEREDLAELDSLSPSPRGELELPDLILRLVRSHRVRPHRIERFWIPITYSWDVLGTMLFLWETPERAREIGIDAETRDSLRLRADVALGEDVVLDGPLFLGSNVRIGRGVRLEGPLALGSGARVEAGARLSRVVGFDDVRVAEGAVIEDSVLGAGVSVGACAIVESRPASELRIDVKGNPVVPEISRLGVVAGDRASIAPGERVPAGTLLAPGRGGG